MIFNSIILNAKIIIFINHCQIGVSIISAKLINRCDSICVTIVEGEFNMDKIIDALV